jgi:hypothetical protein
MKNDKSNTQENNDFLEDLFNKIDTQKLYNKIKNK